MSLNQPHQFDHRAINLPHNPNSSANLRIQAMEAAVLTTPQRASAYHQALGYHGFQPMEILTALQQNPSLADAESLMIHIISRRERSSDIHHQPTPAVTEINWKAIEDAEYDRVLLISEEERNVNERRKRERVTQLTNDCTISISTAPEFINSLLLGLISKQATSWSESTTILSLIQYIEQRHTRGAIVIHLIDDDYSNSSIASSSSSSYNACSNDGICSCLYEMKWIRAIIVRLLLLEKDAIRFYAAVSHPYLQLLAEDIDAKLNSILQIQPAMQSHADDHSNSSSQPPAKKTKKASVSRKKATPTRGRKSAATRSPAQPTSIPATTSSLISDTRFITSSADIASYLESKIKTFEFDLYHLSDSTHGSALSAPKAFRQAELLMMRAGRLPSTTTLDNDGIEVVNDDAYNIAVDAEKQAASWSDISGDESDGD